MRPVHFQPIEKDATRPGNRVFASFASFSFYIRAKMAVVAKRGKARAAGQEEIREAPFAKNMSPRQILASYPNQGFNLNAL